jgi:hypothetical protein
VTVGNMHQDSGQKMTNARSRRWRTATKGVRRTGSSGSVSNVLPLPRAGKGGVRAASRR